MQTKSPQKHVIFLGAGASVTSGYPLANDLRLRLSSEKQMKVDIERLDAGHLASHAAITACFSDFKSSIELFRHGGFGSVDEFAKLAAAKYPNHVQVMKQLTHLGLALHNPEDNFHKSDYYQFVQRLFNDKLVHSLKPNITILSYNYDCYLDYLLIKAKAYRNKVVGRPELTTVEKNILSSGFFDPSDGVSLATFADPYNEEFKHFKLHGSMTYAADHLHRQLFEDTIQERFKPFASHDFRTSRTPIVFPWELFDEGGEFVRYQQFSFEKTATNHDEHAEAVKLHTLYSNIWAGAKEAVQRAQKISFVGLSMHEYLRSGLKFLFKDKRGDFNCVVVNKAQLERVGGRVASMLTSFGRNVQPKGTNFQRMITPRTTFDEFIEKDMD